MKGKGRTLWQLMAGHRVRYLGAIGAMAVSSGVMYFVPLVPQVAIDGVIAPAADVPALTGALVEWGGGREFLRGHLWTFAVAAIGLSAVAGFFTYLRGRWSARATESITRRLRDRLYDHLQHLPCTFHDGCETGDVVQRCTSDVETLRLFLSTQVVEIGRAILMLLAPLPLMLALDARMTLVAVALVPPIVVFALIFFIRIKAAFKQVDEAEGRLTSTLQENLTGIRVVRAFARQDFEREKFGRRIADYRAFDYRMYKLMAGYFSLSDFLCFGQRGLVLGFGIWWLAQGTMQVGTLYYFLAAVSMFIWPVRQMGRILTDLGKAVVAMGRIHEVLSKPTEHPSEFQQLADTGPVEEPAAPIESLRGRITVRNLTFTHASGRHVLNDVSIDVEPGQTLALLGPSGAGKSSLMHLLLRLYDYEHGSIQLDGMELRDLPRKFVRAQMGVVMQEPFLYSKTLRENLKLGRSQASDDELVEAAATASVHDAITNFEKGYDTLVGERGVTLSGGQRQRVALARALLQQPAILILDDALSAVDTRTESMILRALRERRGRHTTLVIAHRLSTLMHADQVVVLDKGHVVQRGTHETLLEEDGLYRRLWRIQTALEEDLTRQLESTAAPAPA